MEITMATTHQPSTPAGRPHHHSEGPLTRLTRWFREEERDQRRTPKPHAGWFD